VLAELGVFLLKLLNLLLKLAIRGAFMAPGRDPVFAIHNVTHQQGCEGDGQQGAGRTPGSLSDLKGALVERNGELLRCRGFNFYFLVRHCASKYAKFCRLC